MLINKNIKAEVTSVKEADKKIIEALKPVYQNEKAKVKLVNQLAMNTVDWILLASDNKQNAEKALPTYDQVKAHLKDLAKSVVPQIIDIGENGAEKKKADPNELSRLSSSISDAVKTALLVAGHETGFIIGHRLNDKSAFIPKDKAYDNNKIKEGIIKDIFWSPIKTFPNKNIGTEKDPVIENNSSTFQLIPNAKTREAFQVHFENKPLNDDKYKLFAEPREKEGFTYSISNADGSPSFRGWKDILEALIQKMEDGDLDALKVKATTNDNTAKNTVKALDKFVEVYQTKTKEFELADKQAEEAENNQKLNRKLNIKKAS
tara:strand:+ start:14846 stop:15802 length:957 start_codon:yes stop_codon:yes gene_type:complete